MILTAASQLLERHHDLFLDRKLLFAGDLQDDYASHLSAMGMSTRVYTTQYPQYRRLASCLGLAHTRFALLPEDQFVASCNTLLYYWPKSKLEAHLQLISLLSCLPQNTELFLVGENRSGIRSVEHLLAPWSVVKKIDVARRCCLYRCIIKTKPSFTLEAFWHTYHTGSLTVKTLPGVFSRDALDPGSRLLLDHLPQMTGNVLDLGCGAGVLGAAIATRYKGITLTLSDVSAFALAASQATLSANQLTGQVVASDLFSDLTGNFDWIISNPPFHQGLKTNYHITKNLICTATHYLTTGGNLLIVANAFLPYPTLLEQSFGCYQLIAKTTQFKVYQATKGSSNA